MSQPLYFLPGVYNAQLIAAGALSKTVLAARGLADVFADVRAGEHIATQVDRGPGGKSGTILCYHRPDGEIPPITGFDAGRQIWHECEGDVWIGLLKDSLPTPEDLSRHKRHGGYATELAGAMWEIPVIRRPDDSTELPRDCYFAKGEFVESIKRDYVPYWERTAEVAEWFFTGDWSTFTKPKALLLCIEAIGLNYRFGVREQNILRAIALDDLHTILMATVDVPRAAKLLDAQKKTSSPSSAPNTTPGPPAD